MDGALTLQGRVCDSTLSPEFSLHLAPPAAPYICRAADARQLWLLVLHAHRHDCRVQLALIYHMRSWHAVLKSPQLRMQAGYAMRLSQEYLVLLFCNLLKLTSLSDCRQVPAYVLDGQGDDEAADLARVSASHLMLVIETAGYSSTSVTITP